MKVGNAYVQTTCETNTNLVHAPLEKLPPKDRLKFMSIKYLEDMLARIIIHELAHAVSVAPGASYNTIIDEHNAYGWDRLLRLPATTAWKNADNYAYLTLWAGLAKKGFTLPRLHEFEEGSDAYIKQASNIAQGIITPYSKITE